jgi:tRNA threonylcarbamoyladenosine biosynthesis protein TsaE
MQHDELYQTLTNSPEQTLALGRQLATKFRPPCLVLLEGELGSGKTTLAKGIVAGLGAAREDAVASPTFTLIHEYGKGRKVYHVDLYRIEDAHDLATLGLEEIIDQNAIVLVEWGEKFSKLFPAPDFHIKLEHLGLEERRITVHAGKCALLFLSGPANELAC